MRRRIFLARAIRKRRELRPICNRTQSIGRKDILVFATVRNEAVRLPYFLDHYRRLGVRHFLFVDNGSTDGTQDYLQRQADVSLWSSSASYKKSRFGLDWLMWLLLRYGHGHWCLTLDADEILIYPYWETRDLAALTTWLDQTGQTTFGTIMLDMYPKGPLQDSDYRPGDDPITSLGWFDAGNYTAQVQPKMRNLWLQGGVRARHFFADEPRKAPTLNKTPLVRWNRRFAYVNSTHALLPPRLNLVYATSGESKMTGVLLHTKFLNIIVEKSAEEKQRREHFANSARYDAYYDGLIANPTLWCPESHRFSDWQQLESLGLMSRGGWI